MSAVAAVAVGASRAPIGALTYPEVDDVVALPSEDGLRDAATNLRAPFLWVIGQGTSPSRAALAPILGRAGRPAASLPVDGLGTPVDACIGRFVESDVEALLDGAMRREVPLRYTRLVSLLVAREHVLDLAPPDSRRFGPYAGLEWTARLFARRGGVLVPESQVRVPTPPPGSARHIARLAGTGVLRKREALRELQRVLTGDLGAA